MSLEDIFITIVDDSVNINTVKETNQGRRKYDYESRKAEEERNIARQIMANANRSSDSAENGDAD